MNRQIISSLRFPVLTVNAALRLVRHYRGSEHGRASQHHTFIELTWYTGTRQGALRALNVCDVVLSVNSGQESWVVFRYCPDTDTPLKSNQRGERLVGVPDETARVVSEYIDDDRYDVHDENGRQPLISSSKGQPNENTVRMWSYRATQPCIAGGCPHDKDPNICEWREYAQLSKCPSSRSPNQIRTRSITWQLKEGLPPELVTERVDATVKTIENHCE